MSNVLTVQQAIRLFRRQRERGAELLTRPNFPRAEYRAWRHSTQQYLEQDYFATAPQMLEWLEFDANNLGTEEGRSAALESQVYLLDSFVDQLQTQLDLQSPTEPEPQQPTSSTSSEANVRKVFVIYGRDPKARDALFAFLRSLDLQPIEWAQAVRATGKSSPYIGEVLDAGFRMAQACVVLLTLDGQAILREDLRSPKDPPYEAQLTGQARPNVLYEAGMARGKFPERTVLVELGDLRPFSDVAGMHTIRMNNSTERRQDLAERLQTAGCALDFSGRDWHTAGVFTLGDASPPFRANQWVRVPNCGPG